LNPIYITEFSVNNDRFSFVVPEVVETIPYGLDQVDLVDNLEGMKTLDEAPRGILFDDVFRMYLVENWHVILTILVDKCHIGSNYGEITAHPKENNEFIFIHTYDCVMSKRGIMIRRG
jgi:hypothetical protein